MTQVRSVLFVSEATDDPHGPPTTFYRAYTPATGLRRLGLHAEVVPAFDQRPDGRVVGIRKDRSFTRPHDAVVFRRIHELGPKGEHLPADCTKIFEVAREAGQVVFYDWDDNMWELPEHNPAAKHIGPAELAVHEANMDAASGVLVSTETLASVVDKHTTAPVFVCPNGVDRTAYRMWKGEHSPLRVAWMSLTAWRFADLEPHAAWLGEELAARGLELWHVGDDPYNPANRPLAELLPHFPVPIRTIPWCWVDKLPDSLAQVDVMVIPMADDALNASRSPTSALACAAAGVAFAGSDNAAYWDTFGEQYPLFPSDLGRLLDDGDYRQAQRLHGFGVAEALAPQKVAKAWLWAFTHAH